MTLLIQTIFLKISMRTYISQIHFPAIDYTQIRLLSMLQVQDSSFGFYEVTPRRRAAKFTKTSFAQTKIQCLPAKKTDV